MHPKTHTLARFKATFQALFVVVSKHWLDNVLEKGSGVERNGGKHPACSKSH